MNMVVLGILMAAITGQQSIYPPLVRSGSLLTLFQV
jgi:hypothetical protein